MVYFQNETMGQNITTNQDVRQIPVLQNTQNTVTYWAEPISPAVEPTQQTPSVQLNSVRPIQILGGMKRVNPDNNESTVPTKKVRFSDHNDVYNIDNIPTELFEDFLM